MRDSLPSLLFYCQHSLGIGHLTRSFALAAALREQFHVVFLNGGRLPPGVPVPAGIELIDLPPLGMDDGHTVVSRGEQADVGEVMAQRRRLIEATAARVQPALLLVELFPFGRKKFATELLPLIRQVRRQPRPGRVVCSLRDILVDARRDQQHHDDRAQWLADRYFDGIVMHADPAFARLEDSFRPRRPLRTPVFYSGYVVPQRGAAVPVERGPHLLVSAGGGIVGQDLYRCVLEARALLPQALPLRLIAGPFLPDADWQALQARCAGEPDIELVRHVGDMVAEMRRARASLSQCGYNSALDLIGAQVPALVVPYEAKGENEQRTRAERLAALGALQWLPTAELTPLRLAQALQALLLFKPRPTALDLDGAARSAAWLASFVHQPQQAAA